MKLVVGLVVVPVGITFFTILLGSIFALVVPSETNDIIQEAFLFSFFLSDLPIIRVFANWFTIAIIPLLSAMLLFKVFIIVWNAITSGGELKL